MSERFIVKGTRIKDTCLDEYLTLREVCKVLNKQDKHIQILSDLWITTGLNDDGEV